MAAITHTCRLASAAELTPLLDQLERQFAWSNKARFQIELALEELIVNTFTHGQPEAAEGEQSVVLVQMQFEQDGDNLSITLIDNGIAFDPTQFEQPDVTSSAEDRAIGGLGQFFVATMMDSMRYERVGDKNRMHLNKQLS